MNSNTHYNYGTRLIDIYNNDPKTFIKDYDSGPFFVKEQITEEQLTTAYWQIYARYDTYSFQSNEKNRCILKLQQVISQYYPNLLTKLKLQDNIKNLTLKEIENGGQEVYGRAETPDTEIDTQDINNAAEHIKYVNSVDFSNRKHNKVNAYLNQYAAIVDGLWDEFLNRFEKLFKPIRWSKYKEMYDISGLENIGEDE